MASQGGTNDNNNKGLKNCILEVLFSIYYFLQRRFLLTMKFLFTIYHHIIFMFYVYRHLSVMRNLKVKD